MEVILSNSCRLFTGAIDRSLGYYIQRHGKRFYGQRFAKGPVPPDGHWRFILACAELVQAQLYFSDIRVSREELKQAMYEAHIFIAMQHLRKDLYDARDILTLKERISL